MFAISDQYIRQQAALTDEQVEWLRARSTVRKLRKWQSLTPIHLVSWRRMRLNDCCVIPR
jgi:hypothetical protein